MFRAILSSLSRLFSRKESHAAQADGPQEVPSGKDGAPAKVFPLYPYLAGAMPLLSVLNSRPDFYLRLGLIWPTARMLLIIWLVTAVAIWGLGRLVRSRDRAALVVFLMIVGFFGFSHLRSLLFAVMPNAVIPYIRRRYLVPLCLILFVFVAALMLRSKRDGRLQRITRILNTGGAIFVLVATSFLFMRFVQVRVADLPLPEVPRAMQTAAKKAELPDIYYVILDSYPSFAILKSRYGFEDPEFESFLKQHGFAVAGRSLANYTFTLPSMASSLNMEYVQAPFFPSLMMRQSRVLRFLKGQGYRTLSVGMFSDTLDGSVDQSMDSVPFGQLTTEVFNSLPLSIYEYQYRVPREFRMLQDVAGTPGPKFVYAHFGCPHPPYAYRANGDPVSFFELFDRSDDLDRLRSYLTYCNRRVMEVIETILARSSRPPIIILQGDHGLGVLDPDKLKHMRVGMMPPNPDRAFLQDRLSILVAVRLPGAAAGFLPQDVTPVNVFRVVFHHVFGTDLDQRPNEFFMWDYASFANFRRVTPLLEGEAEPATP
jgi:hypothetical protein